jgi:hypothetical protein
MGLRAVLIAIDQLANTVIGGEPDETISARAYRLRARKGWALAERVINAMFRDPDHCLHAYELEMRRRQLPREYRIWQ